MKIIKDALYYKILNKETQAKSLIIIFEFLLFSCYIVHIKCL